METDTEPFLRSSRSIRALDSSSKLVVAVPVPYSLFLFLVVEVQEKGLLTRPSISLT